MIKLDDYKQSKLYKQLKRTSRDGATRALLTTVYTVAEKATEIASLVIRYMPQYTLHNERHFLNVLGLMDALIPTATLSKMTPLECALCLMAAYVHDLGMACSAKRLVSINDPKTEEGQAFTAHCEQYHHELLHHQIRLSQDAPDKAQILHGYLLAEFLRTRHTAELGPVRDWLLEISKNMGNTNLFRYEHYDFLDDLAKISVSHGRSVSWLREQLDADHEGHFIKLIRTGEEKTNLAFPGLLLRLADLMDFDASRAPSILFHHIAIENKVSIDEWQKHMAVHAIGLESGQGEPKFTISAACPSPIIHKHILTFAEKIELELAAARGELASQQRFSNKHDLVLPARVDCTQVMPGKNKKSGESFYHYEDLDFRLNQEEIMNLLMGENLYDQPWLCIRELLQNAMDALELRDMRLKLDEIQGEPGKRADLPAGGDELMAHLRWGHDTALDQDWLEVEDNGIGMTFDVIRHYFTQIGKSFYRSHQYLSEQKEFAEKKLPPTSPTSQFGIGILSCFMLAERLEVATHPGKCIDHKLAHDSQGQRITYPLYISISGPGSLFWIRHSPPDGLTPMPKQGTRIRLYLKSKVKIKHDANRLLDHLRKDFRYLIDSDYAHRHDSTKNRKGEQEIVFDPAYAALRHCVWPKYPLRIDPPEDSGKPILAREDGKGPTIFDPQAEVITGASFHGTVLMQPLVDLEWFRKTASKMGIPQGALGNPHWVWWDAVDDTEGGGSGSRFRLWYLRHDDRFSHQPPLDVTSGNLLPLANLTVVTEKPLSGANKTLNLVSGMYVAKTLVLENYSEVGGHLGGMIWLDWRGAAMPRLKADRSLAKTPPHQEVWLHACQNFFAHVAEKLISHGNLEDSRYSVICRTLLAWHIKHRSTFSERCCEKYPLLQDLISDWILYRICLSLDHSLDRIRTNAHLIACDRVRDLVPDLVLDLARDRDLHLDRDIHLDQVLHLALDLARALDLDFARKLDHNFARDFDRVFDLALYRVRARARASDRASKFQPWDFALRLHSLSEMLQPTLENSLPILGCFGLHGRAGDLRLLGPTILGHQPAIPGDFSHPHVVFFEDTAPWLPEPLSGYDLVFPLTAIPLGNLRRRCPEWRKDRRIRPLGTLVFHAPEVAEEFAKAAEKLVEQFKVERILALLPHEHLYTKEWEAWGPLDWAHPGMSALWDIRQGWVKWVWGLADADTIAQHGVDLDHLPPSD